MEKFNGTTVGLGICFFVVFWMLFDSLALGIALGFAMGVAFSASPLNKKVESEAEDSE